MSIEVELKLKIRDKAEITASLKQLGFTEEELVVENDTYIRPHTMILQHWMKRFAFARLKTCTQKNSPPSSPTKGQNLTRLP